MSTVSASQISEVYRAMMQSMGKAKEGPGPPSAIQDRIRRNLVRFIEASGYSVTEVADMAGIPQANLGRWTRGDVTSIPADALPELARALGRASIDDFMSLDPPRQRTKEELLLADPMYSKARPGFQPTEEDLADYQEFVKRVQARRERKKR